VIPPPWTHPIEIRLADGGRVLSRHKTVATAKRPWRNGQLSTPQLPKLLVDTRTKKIIERWRWPCGEVEAAGAATPSPSAESRGIEVGRRVRTRPDYTARWAGLEGVVRTWFANNVRVDLDCGESVTCGPLELELLPWTRLAAAPGYEQLAAVLDEALRQAQAGKGRERHGSGEPFVEQPIVQICEDLGSPQFAIGQARKKSRESLRLPHDRARAELLGAINYLAAAVLVLDRRASAEASR
jgi:hypothetical protein